MFTDQMMVMALLAILGVVLVGPFLFPKIENNLEAFLFVMGATAATVSQVWSLQLVLESISAPVGITLAVLIAGSLFHLSRSTIRAGVNELLNRLPAEWLVFSVIVGLGLLSSLISVIVASLVFVEIVNTLPLNRRLRVDLTIIACFAMGLGAVLTPIGEPLSTILVSKLSGPPYEAGFFYPSLLLGVYVIPGVVMLGGAGYIAVRRRQSSSPSSTRAISEERVREVVIRAIKVFLFVMALILLGEGFKPLIALYFAGIPAQTLYWMNIISAIVDNATLTAAEIGPVLTEAQIRSALMSLLISGGMLIPGNIPNIIAANRLGIKSREWARLGVPLGLVAMVAYFIILFPP